MDTLRTALAQYDELAAKHAALSKKFGKLKAKYAATGQRDLASENEELTREVANLELRTDLAEEKLETLRTTLTEVEESRDFFQQELKTAEADYKKSTEEITLLEIRANAAECERDLLLEEVEEFKEDIANDVKEMTGLESRLESAEAEIDTHLRTIAGLTSEKEFLVKELEWTTDKKNDFLMQRDVALAENDQLVEDKVALQLEIECLRSEKAALERAAEQWELEREEFLYDKKHKKARKHRAE